MNDVPRIYLPQEIDCLDGLQSLSLSSPGSTPRSEEVENKSSSFTFSTADHYQNVKTPTQHPLKLKIIDDSPRLNSISIQREFEFKPSYPSSKSFFPSMRSDSDYESNHNRTLDNIRDYYTPFAVARKQQQKLPEKKRKNRTIDYNTNNNWDDVNRSSRSRKNKHWSTPQPQSQQTIYLRNGTSKLVITAEDAERQTRFEPVRPTYEQTAAYSSSSPPSPSPSSLSSNSSFSFSAKSSPSKPSHSHRRNSSSSSSSTEKQNVSLQQQQLRLQFYRVSNSQNNDSQSSQSSSPRTPSSNHSEKDFDGGYFWSKMSNI